MPSKPNPFDEIERMFDRMSRQFESLDPTDFAGSLGGIPLNIRDEGETFVVTADLPGYESEDIDVTLLDATTLRISAETESDVTSEDETEGEEGVFVRRERRQQSVSRSVALPDRVTEDDTEASYQNGVLTVTLPKEQTDESDSRTIPVNP
ncbi:Hsp20/alpha crystallin family protein [Halorhabdus amylolytica]|uniref:Hsp20/alpha crystallin family protein n=1 Tax=Halorhabdus amylolytica TaxID=2559573 RepID=UPI0010AB38EC|nr:Hsp20/alpha crystallin family protein [Halorhabdus amylolytica]